MSKNLAFEEPVVQLREKIDELKTIAAEAEVDMKTRFATPNASAPPLPPSPITILITGTVKPAISTRFLAIASL